MLSGIEGSREAIQNPTENSPSLPKGINFEQFQAKYGAKPEKPREIRKTLGKDDFLKIMISQMKNQDPTNPFKAEQMAAEIAQFTSVEQLHNVNENLNKMAGQNKPLEQMAMTNLIGKVVTIDRGKFPHNEGTPDSLAFKLPKDSATTKITLISELGETVFEKELGPQKTGEVSFSWDGVRSNTLPAKSGNYMMRIDAKDSEGKSIDTNTTVQSRVIGVSFEGSDPVFLVGDGRHYDKVTLRNIVRIEVSPEQINGQLTNAKEPFSQSTAQMSALPPLEEKSPHFFSFQKGVGSNSVDLNRVDSKNSGVAQAIKKFQEQQVNTNEPMEKGFPNGLKGGDLNDE